MANEEKSCAQEAASEMAKFVEEVKKTITEEHGTDQLAYLGNLGIGNAAASIAALAYADCKSHLPEGGLTPSATGKLDIPTSKGKE